MTTRDTLKALLNGHTAEIIADSQPLNIVAAKVIIEAAQRGDKLDELRAVLERGHNETET